MLQAKVEVKGKEKADKYRIFRSCKIGPFHRTHNKLHHLTYFTAIHPVLL